MNSCPSLDLLQALVVFAKSENMTAASKILGCSQPALSKQLALLESELNVSLFAQVGKKKTLTSYAKDLVQNIEPHLLQIPSSLELAQTRHFKKSPDEIRICARREILDRLAVKLIFASKIIFVESSQAEIINLVKNQGCHLGISHQIEDSYELISKKVLTENFQIVVPKKLQSSRTKNLAALEDLPALAYKKVDDVLLSACHEINIKADKVKIHRVTDNYQSLFAMAQAGLGWCAIPQFLAEKSDLCWHYPLRLKNHRYQDLDLRSFHLIYRYELKNEIWLKDMTTKIIGCLASTERNSK